MYKILVPIDFSDYSLFALEFAVNIAKKKKAIIYIQNVIVQKDYFFAGDPMIYATPYTDLNKLFSSLKRSAEIKLNKITDKKSCKGIQFVTKVMLGESVHKGICKYADSIKADLIIMGTQGASGIKGIFLGSNAERVVRFVKRPVIVINKKMNPIGPKLIVFASDFKDEAYKVFGTVKDFAKIFDSEIHLLKVNIMEQFRRTRDNKELFDKFNKHFKSNYRTSIYDDYTKEEGINNYCLENNADMIAIGTHGKKGLMRFYKSNVSEGMVRLTHRPILVVNFKSRN